MALFGNFDDSYTKTGKGFFTQLANGVSFIPYIGGALAWPLGMIGTVIESAQWLFRGKFGSALTAFRLRRADGSALWSGGSLRSPGQPTQVFADNSVVFVAQRHWSSPASGARYPVQWRVETPAGPFGVQALLDDQELDSSGSTGAIYWEGLSELRNGAGETIGRGYLEMTGYKKPLRL